MPDDVIQKLTVYKLTNVRLDSVKFPAYQLVKRATWKLENRKFPYRLFFHKTGPRPATWLPVFQTLSLSLATKDEPRTMVAGFILIVQVSTSLYGVTGGVGHIHLRKHAQIEYRFGIDLAQRILALPELRGLSQKDTSGIVNALDRVFRGPYNPRGDINNLKRVLTHVRGKLHKQNPLHATIGRSIQASDALTVNGRKKFRDIIMFLVEIDKLFSQGQVKISIPQLQHIGKKANRELLTELELELTRILTQYDAGKTQALFLDNEDIGYLPDRVTRYELSHARQKFDADTFEKVFECVRDVLSGIPTEEDRRDAFYRMHLHVYFDDGAWDERPLAHFLCGDLEYKNEIYFLNNEHWYKASQEFIETMTRELENIECLNPATIGLEEWDVSKFSEEKYFNAAHGDLLVMDRRLVKISDEKGDIEFCDLLKVSKESVYLIHVKHATGAALRALFAQGFVSAKLYAESDEFRSKVYTGELKSSNGALRSEDIKTLNDLSHRHRREMKVVFAIFDNTKSHKVGRGATSTNDVLKGTLSTFAKVDLLDRVTNMRAVGYDIKVTRIKPYPK